MTVTTLPEVSLAAVIHNRRFDDPTKTQIISKRRGGVLTDTFHPMTRGECRQLAEHLAMGLVKMGVAKGDHVAVFSPNRPQWVLTTMAIQSIGAALVPVYPTLTAREAGYVVNHSDAKIIFVGDDDHRKKALEFRKDCPKLEKIVSFYPVADDPNGAFISFDTLVKQGADGFSEKDLVERVKAVREEDLAAIIYTSGTTGVPKGVMLTHANFLSQRGVKDLFDLTGQDTWLSHLPLSHSFGFTADFLGCFEVGGVLGMSEGLDPDSMREALAAIRPTVLMSVPRLYEKLYMRVLSILKSRPEAAQKLFWKAHKVGLEVFRYRNEGKRVPGFLSLEYKAAQVVLTKVKEKAGLDRIRVAYGGGGPLSPDLMAFFNGLGIDIYQGYGLTETSPVATVTLPGKNKLGTVGPPIENVHIKLDVDGEILIKGPNVMKGYYKDDKATAEVMTADGYFRSGDIGRFDDHGRLMITDRKKELIITSAGKNIGPLGIETAFNIDPYIERVILIGDNRNYLTALIGPDFPSLERWAKEQNLSWSSHADLVRKPQVVRLMQERVDIVNKDLAKFETIKKFTIVDHEFSEENGVLTPSQKVKRRVVNEKYKDLIEKMYAGGE